jgi:phosphoglycolate phosphatase
MHVLLFDIDGTLIHTRGSGMIALRQAFFETFGCEAPVTIDTCGRTDRGIARELFLANQLPDTTENWHRFHQTYLHHLAQRLPLGNGQLLPGVTALLESLAKQSDKFLGLLTGNTPEGARIKLVHFGIDHHFGFGGYGHQHVERNVAAESALSVARQQCNGRLKLDQVWVIGDTPADILCARHIGARAVAVATGFHDRDSLARQQPDVLLDDFHQAGEWLSLMDTGVV